MNDYKSSGLKVASAKAGVVLAAVLFVFSTESAPCRGGAGSCRPSVETSLTSALAAHPAAAPSDRGRPPAGEDTAASAGGAVGAADGDSGAAAEGGRAAGTEDGQSAGDQQGARGGWLGKAGHTALFVLSRALLYLFLLGGLVIIPFGVAGTFIQVAAAAVFGLLTGFQQVTLGLLIVITILALVGEGIESVLGVIMARRYGASKWGMWGAFLGGVAGAVLGTPVPVVGNIVGALVGVFLGAFVLEYIGHGRSGSSLRAGWGALLGRAFAAAIKIALALTIMILVIYRTL